jgi:hypothetical protein
MNERKKCSRCRNDFKIGEQIYDAGVLVGLCEKCQKELGIGIGARTVNNNHTQRSRAKKTLTEAAESVVW